MMTRRGSTFIIVLVGLVVTIVGVIVAGITFTDGLLPEVSTYYTYEDPTDEFNFLYPPSLTLYPIDKIDFTLQKELLQQVHGVDSVLVTPRVALRPTITTITSWPDFSEPTLVVLRIELSSAEQAKTFMRSMAKRAGIELDIKAEEYNHLSIPVSTTNVTPGRTVILGAIYARNGSKIINVLYGPEQHKALRGVVESMFFKKTEQL